MIKAVIFDLNGVFIKDSGPLSTRLEKSLGISADDILPQLKETLKQVRQPGADSQKAWQPLLQKLHLTEQEFFDFWFEGEGLDRELLDFAKSLKHKDIKIIILSNNFPERTKNYRYLFPELFEIIDEQYFSWETGKTKPDPEAYKQILEKHSFLPQEYLYFDDSEANIQAASALGINAHLFTNTADAIATVNQYE